MVARYVVHMAMNGYFFVSGYKKEFGLFESEKEVEDFMNKKFESGELQRAEVWFD